GLSLFGLIMLGLFAGFAEVMAGHTLGISLKAAPGAACPPRARLAAQVLNAGSESSLSRPKGPAAPPARSTPDSADTPQHADETACVATHPRRHRHSALNLC